MFTGIIETTGKVISKAQTPAGARLAVDIGELARQVKPGGSVAVNGACLTAVTIAGPVIEFDVVYETLSRTNLGDLSSNQAVNIELALRVTDRLEGHFVQGHIDTTCRIAQWQDQGTARILTLQLDDPQYLKYIIPKGSVALDGISLTVATVSGPRFSIALIPTTLEKTTLIAKPVGATLNLETDILVRTVVHQLQTPSSSDNQLMQTLIQSGFTGG
jgi:riboflavin synthase